MVETLMLIASVALSLACVNRLEMAIPAARLAIRCRAIWLLAGEMVQGAWARRTRWAECLDRARREI